MQERLNISARAFHVDRNEVTYHQDHQNRHHHPLGQLVHDKPWMTLLLEALCVYVYGLVCRVAVWKDTGHGEIAGDRCHFDFL